MSVYQYNVYIIVRVWMVSWKTEKYPEKSLKNHGILVPKICMNPGNGWRR